jgi:outer membrane protein TolC
VAFGAGYELRDSDLALRTSNWNATINLNLPLFDGFSTLSRIRQSRDQAELGRVKKAKLQDQVFLDVRQTYQDCLHWQEEIMIRQKETQRVDALASSYPLGKAPLAEWLQYRSWRLETHAQRDQAIYEHIVARAKLERAVGRPLDD